MKRNITFLMCALMSYSGAVFGAEPASASAAAYRLYREPVLTASKEFNPHLTANVSFVSVNRLPNRPGDNAVYGIAAVAGTEDLDEYTVQIMAEDAARGWASRVETVSGEPTYDVVVSEIVDPKPMPCVGIIASIQAPYEIYPQIAGFIQQNLHRCTVTGSTINVRDLLSGMRPVLHGALMARASLSPASQQKNNYGFSQKTMDDIRHDVVSLELNKEYYKNYLADITEYQQEVLRANHIKPHLKEALLREISIFERTVKSLHEYDEARIGLLLTMTVRVDNAESRGMRFQYVVKTEKQKRLLIEKTGPVFALHNKLRADYASRTLDESACNTVQDLCNDAQKEIAACHDKLRAQYHSFMHATR